MKKRFLTICLFVVAILSACSSTEMSPTSERIESVRPTSEPDGNSLPEPTPDVNVTVTDVPLHEANNPQHLQYIFDTPSDPITVIPNPDSQQQVEATITVAGGTLSATGADGTTYTLDIPSGALADDTLIQMTPLSSLEGMPFGSQNFAVQLEPAGLQFYSLAILTIIPSQELPVDQQIFFGFAGEDENLVLAPPMVNSSEIKMQILHFSGYGVTQGFLADIEPVRARLGGDAEARLQSAIAEQLTRVRQEQLLGIEDSTEVDWEGWFQQWEEQVIKPRLAAAGESCAASQLAIQTILSYERQRALLGMGEGSVGSELFAQGLMDTVAETCMKEEYELCRDDHIIHRILPAWLGLERQFALLGITSDGTSPNLEQAKSYVQRCLNFELEFHSEVNFDDGGDGGFASTVNSTIKVQFIPEDFSLKGESALVNSNFTFKAPDCSVSSQRGGGTFTVVDLQYLEEEGSRDDLSGGILDFKLVYAPGTTSESFTLTCGESTVASPPTPMWTGMYILTHQGEMGLANRGFVAQEWEILGGEYFAKKEWIIELPGEGIIEAGTFKLYHRPQ